MSYLRASTSLRVRPLRQQPSSWAPAVRFDSLHLGLRLSLMVLIFILTTLAGMRMMIDFREAQPPFSSLDKLPPHYWSSGLIAAGLPFSISLLAILLARSLASFFVYRHFDIETTPLRALAGLESNSRIRSRSALIATAAAAPVAAFATATAEAIYGLLNSKAMEAVTLAPKVRVTPPISITLLRATLLSSYPGIPPIPQIIPHPVLVAGWVGMLGVALSLLPAGRLNGGRIIYALSPRVQSITTNITIGGLIYLGTVEWIGWLFLALLLLLPWMRHPKPTGRTPPGVEWLALVPLSAGVFLLTISTQPIVNMSLTQVLLRMH